MMCVKDIVRFSNMSLKEQAVTYYGEDQFSIIFPLDHKVCRAELISTSLKTLDKLICDGGHQSLIPDIEVSMEET